MEKAKINLNNVKSNFILRKIFDKLDITLKLNLIRHNKTIQNKIGINIDDYKMESRRIRILVSEGFGYEYKLNSNIIIFEGYYLNGEKNGKGKEYNEDGKIKFEGEYLKGKIIEGKEYDNYGNIIIRIENGKIIEYYSNGNIKFKGTFFNGRKWNGKGYDVTGNEIFEIKKGKGIWKEYDKYGILKFEGEFINGKKNGKGNEYFDDGLIRYEGNYINGKRSGLGKEYYNDDIIFDGNYKNGLRWNGKGYNSTDKTIYEIKNGEGFGKEYNYDKTYFIGNYLNGEKNGAGKEYQRYGELIFDGN